jgi:hypothetical protein
MRIFTLCVLFIVSFSFTASADIKLKSFNVGIDGTSAKITWELGEMSHDVTCYLQRSSNGQDFQNVETYQIREGFTGTMQATNSNLAPGYYYYRLFISKPGFLPYISGMVSAKISRSQGIHEYRVVNPFRQHVTIKGKFNNKPVKVVVADMNGRVRMSTDIKSANGGETITIDTGNLDNGMYIVRVNEIKDAGEELLLQTRIIKNGE